MLYTYIIVCLFIQFSSVAQSCPTLCYPMNHSMPGLPVHHQLPEFTQTHVHQVGDAIQPSHPLPSPFPPAPIPPNIRVFSNESTLRKRWPKYWNFSFSISPSKEYPGLIYQMIQLYKYFSRNHENKSFIENEQLYLFCIFFKDRKTKILSLSYYFLLSLLYQQICSSMKLQFYCICYYLKVMFFTL